MCSDCLSGHICIESGGNCLKEWIADKCDDQFIPDHKQVENPPAGNSRKLKKDDLNDFLSILINT